MFDKIHKCSILLIILFSFGAFLKNKQLCKVDFVLISLIGISFTVYFLNDFFYDNNVEKFKILKKLNPKKLISKVGSVAKKVVAPVKNIVKPTTTVPTTTGETTTTTGETTTTTVPTTTGETTTTTVPTTTVPTTTVPSSTTNITGANTTYLPTGSSNYAEFKPTTTTVPTTTVSTTTVPTTTVSTTTVPTTTVPTTTVSKTTVPSTVPTSTITVSKNVGHIDTWQRVLSQKETPKKDDIDVLIKKGLVQKYDFLNNLAYQNEDPLYYINSGDLIDNSFDSPYTLVDSKHWKPHRAKPPVCVRNETPCEPCAINTHIPYLDVKKFNTKSTV